MNKIDESRLKEAATRNRSVTPERVREMLQVVQRLRHAGVVEVPKYRIQPGLDAGARQIVPVTLSGTFNRL